MTWRSPRAAVLALTSVGLDATGRPVEWSEALHRGDRTRWEVQLTRRDGDGSSRLPFVG